MTDPGNISPLVVGGAGGILSAAALWAYSVFAPRCQFYAPVIRSLPQREAVALTFNDGPHPEFTPRILEILARHGATATFFLIGKQAAAHPDLVKAIHAAGHALGNHTYDHAPFRLRDEGYWSRQIARTQETIAAITGELPVLFRSPGGYKTRSLARAARTAHLPFVGWSLRGDPGDAKTVGERLLKRTTGHDILLLHDGHPPHLSVSRQYVADLLPDYLLGVQEKKLKVVSLVEALIKASDGVRAGAEKTRRRAAES